MVDHKRTREAIDYYIDLKFLDRSGQTVQTQIRLHLNCPKAEYRQHTCMQFTVFQSSFIFQTRYPDAVTSFHRRSTVATLCTK